MIARGALLAIAIFACGLVGLARAESITFEREVTGIPPLDFEFWGTGDAGPGLWAVAHDDSANGGRALEQYRRDPTPNRVALAIYKPFSGEDVEAEIRFKAMAGSLDQSAGVAVRLTTPDDYYVAEASALAQDIRLYRVAKGNWREIGKAEARVTPKEWHSLALRAESDRIVVAFDGRQLLEATDATFKSPGKVALWTKADSVIRFDHLKVQALP